MDSKITKAIENYESILDLFLEEKSNECINNFLEKLETSDLVRTRNIYVIEVRTGLGGKETDYVDVKFLKLVREKMKEYQGDTFKITNHFKGYYLGDYGDIRDTRFMTFLIREKKEKKSFWKRLYW